MVFPITFSAWTPLNGHGCVSGSTLVGVSKSSIRKRLPKRKYEASCFAKGCKQEHVGTRRDEQERETHAYSSEEVVPPREVVGNFTVGRCFQRVEIGDHFYVRSSVLASEIVSKLARRRAAM